MTTLRGLPGAPGRAWGRAWSAPTEPAVAPPADARALALAISRVRRDLRREQRVHPGQADILDVQLVLLEDPMLTGEAMRMAEAGMEAGEAWQRAGASAARLLAGIPDERMQARVADLRDVTARVAADLSGRKPEAIPAGAVVLAWELTPSLVLQGARRGAVAFAAQTGSPRSHACIILRSLGLPAVVGVGGLQGAVAPDDEVLVDGDRGRVVPNPSLALKARCAPVALPADPKPAVTPDGRVVPVVCNVANLEEVRLAAALGADGVGVFRTEHLFTDSPHPPASGRQQHIYRQAVEAMSGRPVVIRALDAGADKPLPYLDAGCEANPALGWRGLRNLLDRPRLFRSQVTAVLHAGAAALLLPMVTTAEEVRRARRLIAECERRVGRTCRLGVMVEVPAAALAARALVAEADFLSVGTNDLFQYAYAVDRTNTRLEGRFDPLEPAFLRLLAGVGEAGREAGKPVHLCGELASDPRLAGLWLGLGISELSVRPPCVAAVKAAVRRAGPDRADLARAACACGDAATVRRLLRLR